MIFDLLKTWYVREKTLGLDAIGNACGQEIFAADAVGEFLRQDQTLVHIENGGVPCSVQFQGVQEVLSTCLDSRNFTGPTQRCAPSP